MFSLHSSTNSADSVSAPAAAPVLVIDDDPQGAAATQLLLTGGGHQVASQADGDEVLRLVRASLMAMVVSELYIPCSEGPCVVTALKQDRTRLPRLRVLVYTRHTSAEDVEWALAAGADTVVYKPAADHVVLREVDRLLRA